MTSHRSDGNVFLHKVQIFRFFCQVFVILFCMTDDELLSLNSQGFIPGPLESEEHFLHRVSRVKNSLTHEEKIPPSDWDWTRQHLKFIFDFEPESLPVFYSNKSLAFWEAAAAWIEEGRLVGVQLREGLKKGSYLHIYSREEILSHEAVHAARSAFNEPENEEFFAYLTSEAKWRRFIGPILRRTEEGWIFLGLLAISLFFPFMYAGALFWMICGCVRLIKQHLRLKKASEHIFDTIQDPKKVRAILVRLTDREINLLAQKQDLQEYANNQTCLRWKLIRLAYF